MFCWSLAKILIFFDSRTFLATKHFIITRRRRRKHIGIRQKKCVVSGIIRQKKCGVLPIFVRKSVSFLVYSSEKVYLCGKYSSEKV